MEIEIWSDVVCPFCYIGKRHLEIAVEDLNLGENVNVVYKSFQLDPHLEPIEGKSLYQHLSDSKGMPVEQAKQLSESITERASAVGIEFNFDDAVVANTEKAHHLLHLAAQHGKQAEMKNHLLKAYFTDGKDLNKTEVLHELASELGYTSEEVTAALVSTDIETEIKRDQLEANQIGVRGVPFFVINRKYAVSGAQPIDTFKDVLQKVSAEESPLQHVGSSDADACDIDGQNC